MGGGTGTGSRRRIYGFTVQNPKIKALELAVNVTHLGGNFSLREDSYAHDEFRGIACVADGISRDFSNGSAVTRDLKGIMKFLNGKYPNPSPAREVAEICTKTFLETKSLEEANERIRHYNLKNNLTETDYLGRDLAGCTAAAFSSDDKRKISYWFIADSGIAIIDEKGELKFKTPDEGPHSPVKNPYLEKILNQHGGWNSPEGRNVIRTHYRNNPKEPFAYGALTGEAAAIDYVKIGSTENSQGDYILLFTDGMGELLFPPFDKSKGQEIRKEYADRIFNEDINGLKKLCQKNVHSEGTLIVYKVE